MIETTELATIERYKNQFNPVETKLVQVSPVENAFAKNAIWQNKNYFSKKKKKKYLNLNYFFFLIIL
jgi:hypothetical protein